MFVIAGLATTATRATAAVALAKLKKRAGSLNLPALTDESLEAATNKSSLSFGALGFLAALDNWPRMGSFSNWFFIFS